MINFKFCNNVFYGILMMNPSLWKVAISHDSIKWHKKTIKTLKHMLLMSLSLIPLDLSKWFQLKSRACNLHWFNKNLSFTNGNRSSLTHYRNRVFDKYLHMHAYEYFIVIKYIFQEHTCRCQAAWPNISLINSKFLTKPIKKMTNFTQAKFEKVVEVMAAL